jgi:hypothetical protein
MKPHQITKEINMPKASHQVFKASVTVHRGIRDIKDKNEMLRMISTIACYPVEHPETQGYEVLKEPTVSPTDHEYTYDVEIPVRARDADLLVESAICHRLMRGFETEEPYGEADALFDLMMEFGGGPVPEEMGLEFKLIGLERARSVNAIVH